MSLTTKTVSVSESDEGRALLLAHAAMRSKSCLNATLIGFMQPR